MKKKIFTKKSLSAILSGKRMLVCMALAVASVGFTYAQEDEGDMSNIILNRSFEEGSYTNDDGYLVPNGWTLEGEIVGADVTLKNTNAHHGTWRYYIWATVGTDLDFYQDITLDVGTYTLKAATKPRTPDATTLYVKGGAENYQVLAEGNWDVWGNPTIEFAVPANNTTIRLGVTSTDAFMLDNFRLTKLFGSKLEALNFKSAELEYYSDSLASMGFVVASAELVAVLNKYAGYDENTPETEIDAAIEDMDSQKNSVLAVFSDCLDLKTGILRNEALLADCEAGVYVITDVVKERLVSNIATAKGIMNDDSLADLAESAQKTTEDLNTVYTSTMNVISVGYPLFKAIELADGIGNLENTPEYQNALTVLNAVEISFDDVASNVQALNLACKNVMTEEFLKTASDENPIELTSFIINPNIYQSGASSERPTGWNCKWSSADSKDYTREGYSDTHLYCFSWSGDAINQIGRSHYYQKIGGDDVPGTVALPDGLYTVKAATYTSAKLGEMLFYASTDSVNFIKAGCNIDREFYDKARAELDVTTVLENVEVRNGVLYLGIKGKYLDEGGHLTGLGMIWYADNFRLYYVNNSAVAAYQERLQSRLDKGSSLYNTLIECGIKDVDDNLGYYLEEYSPLVTSESIEEIEIAIEELDEIIVVAEEIIKNYKALSSLVTAGENLYEQLENKLIVAQPAALNNFTLALEAAEEIYAELTWDSMYYEAQDAYNELKKASDIFKVSIALCYPLAKAKLLAETIGGMSNNPAYLKVIEDLKNDNLDQMDADFDVIELNAACVSAMTPDVLAKATVENPFDMTSFIINPNIYQNSVDENTGAPINTKINGWTIQSRADKGYRTEATQGDTWLYCYSWSGNTNYNVGLGNNYYQIVGTNGEGTLALPAGTYRISAATYSSNASQSLDLYAVTRESYMNDDNIAYRDSVYYSSKFNGNKEKWDIAQSTVSTTTDVSSIHVKNGALSFGVRGTAIIGGNGSSWIADNFRLYYIGAGEIIDSVDETLVDGGNTQPEFVDVYDLTGRLIRKQVKATNAVEGLKKGFYIVGGKKVIVR